MGEATTTRMNAAKAKGGGGNGRADLAQGGAAQRTKHPAEEVRELFHGEVGAAKERLVELLHEGTERIAFDAANAILDRVFGKPRQVAEPPGEKRPLLPIAFYEVDCVTRPEVDGPGMGGHD